MHLSTAPLAAFAADALEFDILLVTYGRTEDSVAVWSETVRQHHLRNKQALQCQMVESRSL